MTRVVLLAFVALATVGGRGPADLRAQQTTFRARTDVVSVNVSVKRGREPVMGLTAADFEVKDNGVPQTVSAVSLDRVPIDVTLLLTEFPIGRTDEHRATLAAAEGVRDQLRQGDRLRLVIAEDDVRGRMVETDTDYDLRYAHDTRKLVSGTLIPGGHRISWPSTEDNRVGAGIALVDGVFFALSWPVDPDRRHLVVAFTDGHDSASTLEAGTLPRLAARSDAVLHGVFWATPQSADADLLLYRRGAHDRAWEASYDAVDQAIRRTGGTLQRTGQAARALASVIADFRSSYVLRFTPRDTPAPGWHELAVRVTRPGSFTVRARKGYEY